MKSNLKLNIHVTQSKNCCWWHGVQETFTNLYFPSATLIRLYELLKNSRVNQTMLTNNKEAFFKASLLLMWMVEDDGIEPTTPCLQSRCSPSWANPPFVPHVEMVGLVGLEPTTPALSRRCSNQLSYRPKPVATLSTFKFPFKCCRRRQPSNNR